MVRSNSCVCPSRITRCHNVANVYVSHERLVLDGSTRASEFCFIVDVSDVEMLLCVNIHEVGSFPMTQKVVHRLAEWGAFLKRWLVIPVNVGLNHWVLVSILNPLSLGKAQREELTAYFLFDANGATTRDCDLKIMKDRGIFNLLIYANARYGSFQGKQMVNICQSLMGKLSFPKIGIHPEDDFRETENSSSCIYVVLAMIEMALVHSYRCSTQMDFDMYIGDEDFRLRKGQMFSIFRNKKKKFMAGKVSLPMSFIHTVHAQLSELWNRIALFKGRTAFERTWTDSLNLPSYAKHSFRVEVWEIPVNCQTEIQWHIGTSKEREQAIEFLLTCQNRTINACIIYAKCTAEELDKICTVEESMYKLLEYGMEVILAINDGKHDDETDMSQPGVASHQTVAGKTDKMTALDKFCRVVNENRTLEGRMDDAVDTREDNGPIEGNQ